MFIIISVLVTTLGFGTRPFEGEAPVVGYIVQSELDSERFIEKADSTFGQRSTEIIYAALGIYIVDVPLESRAEAVDVLSKWKAAGICSEYYRDVAVYQRVLPNDPLYGEQWDMDRIDCPEAWDITSGGITSSGDTIVIAVLDAGFYVDHIDIRRNTWVNHQEIPNDGVDNDANGYVDDYRGAYTAGVADDHPRDPHGASVSGIIGADGNNGRGVTGVNWNVKVMPVSGISRESEVIAAYQYVRTMRKLWNDTNGEKGAFVVATNLSAGTDGEFGKDHPMWCGIYDDLGQLGVLNVCSVTNLESHIDVEGDLPATCKSEFLLAVTNTNRDDIRVMPSGYGQIHVDMAAPGSGSFTIVANNNYSTFGGTSAAAPHVAGTVGLMYAVDCPDIMSVAISDPGSAAIRMKSAILQTVNPLNSLTNTTASGGRLETGAAVEAVCPYFSPEINILTVTKAYPNPTRDDIMIEFVPASFTTHYIEVFDVSGRLVFEDELYPSSNPSTYTASVAGQVAGVYIAVITSRNQNASVRFLLM